MKAIAERGEPTTVALVGADSSVLVTHIADLVSDSAGLVRSG